MDYLYIRKICLMEILNGYDKVVIDIYDQRQNDSGDANERIFEITLKLTALLQVMIWKEIGT